MVNNLSNVPQVELNSFRPGVKVLFYPCVLTLQSLLKIYSRILCITLVIQTLRKLHVSKNR